MIRYLLPFLFLATASASASTDTEASDEGLTDQNRAELHELIVESEKTVITVDRKPAILHPPSAKPVGENAHLYYDEISVEIPEPSEPDQR